MLTGICATVPARAQAPDVVTTFAGGPPNGRYAFASWTPKSLAELLQGNKTGETVNIDQTISSCRRATTRFPPWC